MLNKNHILLMNMLVVLVHNYNYVCGDPKGATYA